MDLLEGRELLVLVSVVRLAASSILPAHPVFCPWKKWLDRLKRHAVSSLLLEEDDSGTRYRQTSRGFSTSGEIHEVTVGYSKPDMPKVGPATRLIVEDWTILNHAIPFEFKDIPLP